MRQTIGGFDEEGVSFDHDRSKFFFRTDEGKMSEEPFDLVIRDFVFQLLKYKGNFKNMI